MAPLLVKKYLLLLLTFYASTCFAEVGYVEPWGRDTALVKRESSNTSLPPKKSNLWIKMATGIIHFHQKVISPVDGPRSHYRPSSSHYMLQAMQKHGFAQGFIMGCDRLLRENSDPWLYKKTRDEGMLLKWDPVK
ncbi:hypothetical protein COB21_05965 [Candidatus Aerophobetes bacterium]|uniref:Membrane protein insertion efficiency factor YidD n=1 Tax=Aerophobetes bacterium TaxID=2030807 RepID=A0A2A4WY14_UNCAE|nr:MAG: hypothetical protein COB21_05965 [Candidatus Aerophobetes bacterium]